MKYKLTYSELLSRFIIYLLLIVISLLALLPMWHVLMQSLSDPILLTGNTKFLWLPLGEVSTYGYQQVLGSDRFIRGFIMSVIYMVSATAFGVFIMTLGGYVLSRPKLMLKKPLMIFFLITLFFNGGMIPLYMVVRSLGLTNTPLALIIPAAGSAFQLILIKNGMESIPNALTEAAVIDGASHLQILFKIILPLSVPYIAVVAMFSAIAHWNAWLNASMFLDVSHSQYYPLQLILRDILMSGKKLEPNMNIIEQAKLPSVRAAAIIVSSAPLIIIYPFIQKFFEKGIVIGSVKG